MKKRRSTINLIFLISAIFLQGATCRSLLAGRRQHQSALSDVNAKFNESSTENSRTENSTEEASFNSSFTSESTTLINISDANIENSTSIQNSTTPASPIQMIFDVVSTVVQNSNSNPGGPIQTIISTVSSAVQNLFSPLFDSSQAVTKQNSTSDEEGRDFDDFDDPGDEEQEDTRVGLVSTVLRHARDALVEEGRQGGYASYYDFLVNEYSYKFWAVYMLLAAGLLLYSAIAAIYYAKFNTSAIDYELYDELGRSNSGTPSVSNPLGLVGSLVSVQTFQRIMDAIASEKYS